MHREREQAAQKSLATQNRIATLVLSRSPLSAAISKRWKKLRRLANMKS